MTELALHDALVAAWFALAAVTFASLFFITAPYGRHVREGWGPRIPARVGWILMESPAVILPITCAALGTGTPGGWLALALWLLHYGNRTIVWPLRMRLGGRPMPLSIAGLAFGTNILIDSLVFRDVFTLRVGAIPLDSPLTWLGVGLFALGLGVNVHSDEVLRRLRAPGDSGYRIPYGGAYRWVSCPNYLGEIVEWAGFALVARSPAAWAFVAWTVSNLSPRARSNHRWYRETFPDYPPDRRALVPFLW